MCGIVGLIRLGPPAGDDAARVRAGADAIRSRGPDDEGLWSEAGACLGHRRLSVLDTSAAGHQPMASADGRWWIVFNGEVYNFRALRAQLPTPEGGWRSDGDTEVVLAAWARWGAASLARLRGMFAFALWDRLERRLVLVRDRLGVKPLYWAAHGGAIAFASRPRALRACLPELPADVDPQALRLFLESGYVPAPLGMQRGLNKLEPGHLLVHDAAGTRIERWWDPLAIAPDPALGARAERALLDELDELVCDSVRLRLVSDVPLGTFLSGGIDSSLVAAVMARVGDAPPRAFTIGFTDPRFDESPHAAAVARHIGAEHRIERLEVDDLLALVPRFVAEYDEPFFDYSAFPTMAVARLARRSVTVALSGDGGDELFGGYHYYRIVRGLAPAFAAPAPLRRAAAALLGRLPAHRARLLAGALRRHDPVDAFAFARSVSKGVDDVLRPEARAATHGLSARFAALVARMPAGLSAADQAMRLDLCSTLPDDYLQKVDVASMAFSLEAREPLLDHRLVEWALRLPVDWKLRGGTSKYLLRQLAYRYLPRDVLDRPKQGFSVPLSQWLRGPLRTWAEERLTDPAAFRDLPVDQHTIRTLWTQHRDGARDAHTLLWSLIVLAAWRQSLDARPGPTR